MTKVENKHITVYEHQKLLVGKDLSQDQYEALLRFYGNYSPFFTLIRNGVKFCSYVGVLQVGNTLIEILPKADISSGNGQETLWQKVLIQMLRTVWGFSVRDAGSSHLKIKHHSVLDLYFELYLFELEKLIHYGLIKKYRREERNTVALKGKLAFTKHIQNNLVHQERFYIETFNYTLHHLLHQVLYTALKVVQNLNRNTLLHARIGNLLLHFPEQKPIKVTPSTFERLHQDRKSLLYRPALEIAELLLLNYHPDISQGHKHVLALMFDMNALWEQFVLRLLQRNLKSYTVSGQVNKKFWKSTTGSLSSSLRPDILIHGRSSTVVLDTKWKYLNGEGPSADDLRQMYVYQEYFQANMAALIYPGTDRKLSGAYFQKEENKHLDTKECHILQISVEENTFLWQKKIVAAVEELFQNNQN